MLEHGCSADAFLSGFIVRQGTVHNAYVFFTLDLGHFESCGIILIHIYRGKEFHLLRHVDSPRTRKIHAENL